MVELKEISRRSFILGAAVWAAVGEAKSALAEPEEEVGPDKLYVLLNEIFEKMPGQEGFARLTGQQYDMNTIPFEGQIIGVARDKRNPGIMSFVRPEDITNAVVRYRISAQKAERIIYRYVETSPAKFETVLLSTSELKPEQRRSLYRDLQSISDKIAEKKTPQVPQPEPFLPFFPHDQTRA